MLPYHVCVLNGEQGSAKSSTLQLLRTLVDPVLLPESDKAREPRDERDLAIEADGNFCVSFDNISKLPQWLSDAFCRLATGGAFKTRKLYHDDELRTFSFKRPVILNGIANFVVAGDLASRSLVFDLPSLSEERRQDERLFWSRFESALPQILGAIYSGLSHGLRTQVELDSVPRMADSYQWVARCVGEFGWCVDDWQAAYAANEEDKLDIALQSSKVASLVLKFIEFQNRDEIAMPIGEFYRQLHSLCDPDSQRYMPASPKTLDRTSLPNSVAGLCLLLERPDDALIAALEDTGAMDRQGRVTGW